MWVARIEKCFEIGQLRSGFWTVQLLETALVRRIDFKMSYLDEKKILSMMVSSVSSTMYVIST